MPATQGGDVNLPTAKQVMELALRKTVRLVEKVNRRYSLVGASEFFEEAAFPWIEVLEAGAPLIRRELDEVLAQRDRIPNFQQISSEQTYLTQDDQWKTFFFYAYGYRDEENCARCPETVRLLSEIPGLKTAFFSILGPRKHIRAHRGPFNGVLRYHLALKVPDEAACRIRVGDTVRHWRDGKSMIFDDSYEHEAWNDSDGERVVLFADFVRPLPALAAKHNEFWLNLAKKSPFVKNGVQNLKQWHEHGDAAAP
jgi:aspartyl/asparaginyl beta-hydroxylase (cupin superfamily)